MNPSICHSKRMVRASALLLAAFLALPSIALSNALPPLKDPFAPGGLDCSTVPAKELEKLDCSGVSASGTRPAPVTDSHANTFLPPSDKQPDFAETNARLPDFRDPFSPDDAPPKCDALAVWEREKFGFEETCAPTETAALKELPPSGTEAAGERPLKREDLPDLDRRVLSLPGAQLNKSPGEAASEGELPAFTVFYVYEARDVDGANWLRVGKDAHGKIDGWIKGDHVEDWRTMLVMQYAPKGARDRVLFFRREDDIITFATDPYVGEEVQRSFEEIENGEHDTDYFVAIEPNLGVDRDSTYLMPVLNFRQEFSALGEPMTLLEVAGLNTDAAAAVQSDVREIDVRSAPRRASAFRRLKFGITFVIDTTSSMGPYIHHTRSIVRSTVERLRAAGAEDSFSFGLIGYRDNTDVAENVGYVTKVFQPLDPNSSIDEMLENFELMRRSNASTVGFSEDAFAGLYTAIRELDWEPFDVRMVVLITDAGARSGDDPLAAYPNYGALNVAEDARSRNIAVSVIHLLTEAGIRSGNVSEAEPKYRELTKTGDLNFEKYLPIDTRDDQAFVAQIAEFQEAMVKAVGVLRKSRPVDRPDNAGKGSSSNLGQVLINEVFRVQWEVLGDVQNQAAPRFYRAWASDRDLRTPSLKALEVKALLTRDQIAALSKGAQNILDAYLRKATSGGDFFGAIQAIAAETSVEGNRTGDLERVGQLFPSFLAALPYRSAFLQLDEKQWRAEGPGGQTAKIDELKNKLLAYRDLAEQRHGWIDLGAGDKGLELYALSLDLLP